MGRDAQAACLTCRVLVVGIGYGSSLTWLDNLKTVAEYDAAPPDGKRLAKNINWREFLGKHDGHEWKSWSSDWAGFTVRDGRRLVAYDQDDKVIADVTGFDVVNMEDPRG